jgi:hypothetical protein
MHPGSTRLALFSLRARAWQGMAFMLTTVALSRPSSGEPQGSKGCIEPVAHPIHLCLLKPEVNSMICKTYPVACSAYKGGHAIIGQNTLGTTLGRVLTLLAYCKEDDHVTTSSRHRV